MIILKIIHFATLILLLLSTLIYTTLPSKFSKVKLFLLIRRDNFMCFFIGNFNFYNNIFMKLSKRSRYRYRIGVIYEYF